MNALRDGAHGHLIKGASDREQLVAALQAVGRGGSILSPAMAGLILDELNHLIVDEMSHRYQLFERAQATAVAQARPLGSESDRQVME